MIFWAAVQVPAVFTVKANDVECDADDPVPVIVRVYVPAAVELEVEIVSVDGEPAVTDEGENDAVTPVGSPVAPSETVCAEPEVTAVETVADASCDRARSSASLPVGQLRRCVRSEPSSRPPTQRRLDEHSLRPVTRQARKVRGRPGRTVSAERSRCADCGDNTPWHNTDPFVGGRTVAPQKSE